VAFAEARRSANEAHVRPELSVTAIPAPSNLAPFSFALASQVRPAKHDSESELGTGRFVLLYDPAEPEAWGGPMRVICYVQAPVETEMGGDPFAAGVTWSWLMDALAHRGATYESASGTATRILSTGFGELHTQGDGAQMELRASWSPTGSDLGAHVEGWGELLCMLAGLPPSAEGVRMLPVRRVGRG